MSHLSIVETPAETRADAARERLLTAASRLFCRHGITATGVDAIVERAGTAKATLYKLFGSKEQLVEAVLEREGQLWRTWFFDRLAALDLPPREKLEAVFDILGDWFRQDDFSGCPFINAVGEYDKADDRIRGLALRHKGQVDRVLRDLAVLAGARDPDSLVSEVGLLMDGAIVIALVGRRPDVAAQAKTAYRTLAAGHFAD